MRLQSFELAQGGLGDVVVLEGAQGIHVGLLDVKYLLRKCEIGEFHLISRKVNYAFEVCPIQFMKQIFEFSHRVIENTAIL